MRHSIGLLALFAVAFAPAAAQAQETKEHQERQEQHEQQERMEHMERMEHHGTGMASVQRQYQQMRDWIIASAEMLPEENYGFRPTEEVRSFGELIGHLANAGYFFCSSVLDEDSPNSVDIEETVTAKAELVEALKTSFAYCDRAHEISEPQAMESLKFFSVM